MIKGSIQEEDITVVNIYAPTIGELQHIRLKVRAWKKIFCASGDKKKVGVARFISDKIDLKGPF